MAAVELEAKRRDLWDSGESELGYGFSQVSIVLGVVTYGAGSLRNERRNSG